jgi:hypothetical protein
MPAHRGCEVDGEHDLGVLFVHGIGDPERGQTLTQWADALTDWLSGWLGEDAMQLGAARLAVDPVAPGAPAHLDVEVALPGKDSGVVTVRRWRMAEGWWARSFAPPRAAELAFWSFGVVPVVALTHFALRLQRAWSRPVAAGSRVVGWIMRGSRVGRAVVELLVTAALAPLGGLLLLVVLLMRALPIGWVRSLAAGLQRVVSQTVGDSYIFLGSSTRRAAVTHAVEADLRWLAGSCRDVVVVAHSQGAEVAHRAIRAAGLPQVVGLVTLGSGQDKLTLLQAARTDASAKIKRVVWLAPLGAIVLAVALAMVTGWWPTTERADTTGAVGGSIGLAALFLVAGVTAASVLTERAAEARLTAPRQGWLNLYASHDPVSNGPIIGIGDSAPESSEEVTNRRSTLLDHTSYHHNSEQVLARIATVCAAACGGTLEGARSGYGPLIDHAALSVAVARRRWRVGWLLYLRLLTWTSCAVTLLLERRQLAGLGGRLTRDYQALQWIPLIRLDLDQAAPAVRSGVGVLAVLAVFGLASMTTSAIWRHWDRSEGARSHTRRGFALWPAQAVTLIWAFPAHLLLIAALTGTVDLHLQLDPVLVGVLLYFTFIQAIGAMVLALIMFALVRVQVIHRDRMPLSTGEQAAVYLPGMAISLLGHQLYPQTAFWPLMIFVGVLALTMLLPPILGSRHAVQRLLMRLRTRTWAGPIPLAATPLLGAGAIEVHRAGAVADQATIGRLETAVSRLQETHPERSAPRVAELNRQLGELGRDAAELARHLLREGDAAAARQLLTAVADHAPDAAELLRDLGAPTPATEPVTEQTS